MNAYLLGFTSILKTEVQLVVYATDSEQAERKARDTLGNELVNSRLSWWSIVSTLPRPSIRVIR